MSTQQDQDAQLSPNPSQANPRPLADFVPCLLTALMAALPYFLEAFVACLTSQQPGADYKPGTRKRC